MFSQIFFNKSETIDAIEGLITSIIELLKAFPILLIISSVIIISGINLILVGYGVKNTIKICDTSELDKEIAKKAGIFFIGGGLLLLIGYYTVKSLPTGSNKDPFFIYYFISVLLFVGLICLIAINKSKESTKVEAFRITFILTALLITLTVFWRAINIYFYINEIKKYPNTNIPFGLCSVANFVPYFILLGIGVITAFIMIYRSTKNYSNKIIFQYVSLCTYLLICRILWEVVDNFAKAKINPC
ncbi:MAG: hypothetical protein QNJ54_31235 [Prochloraceae cyanobacterium]|nr:hypothetical protein [Prochloraceae cyanobacterium]